MIRSLGSRVKKLEDKAGGHDRVALIFVDENETTEQAEARYFKDNPQAQRDGMTILFISWISPEEDD